MEGLIVLAVIWFVFSQIMKAGGAKNAKRGATSGAPRPAQSAPASPGKTVTQTVMDIMGEDRAQEDEDEAGCVGGSLPHTQHEGETLSGSLPGTTRPKIAAVPSTKLRPRTTMTTVAAPAGRLPVSAPAPTSKLTPRIMRNAVLLAEVLGKPVALREDGMWRQ